ncbi:MAG: hypothetical protein V4508_08685 [Pseudomonadota bacterium]
MDVHLWFEIRLRTETETELMASMVGQFGSTRHASAVQFRDGKLTLRTPRQYEAEADDLVFDGALDGEQLSGTTERGQHWVARRAPQRSAGASRSACSTGATCRAGSKTSRAGASKAAR